MEACVGCGAEAGRHPIAAVVRDESTRLLDTFAKAVAPLGVKEVVGPDRFMSVPVCEACWRNPAHRKTPIKGHFFQRSEESTAVRLAGSGAISMGGAR
jgi:hypothetical protein